MNSKDENWICPICYNNLFSHDGEMEGFEYDNAHFTTVEFKWGGGLFTSLWTNSIKYCHVGHGFVECDEYGFLSKIPTTKDCIYNMVFNINKSQIDVTGFIAKHEFFKQYDDSMSVLDKQKLRHKLSHLGVTKSINWKCKIGIHKYIPSSRSDVLLECNCGKTKLNFKMLCKIMKV